VQTLIPLRADNPHNKIVCTIGRCNPRRASTALSHAPRTHDRWWIRRHNFVGGDRARIVMKTKICSLACVIGDSRCPSVNPSHVRLGRGCSDTAEIVAVDQIGIAIFAQGKHELGGRSSRHIDDSRTDTAQIGVAIIEI
jgi:hypothetical protein